MPCRLRRRTLALAALALAFLPGCAHEPTHLAPPAESLAAPPDLYPPAGSLTPGQYVAQMTIDFDERARAAGAPASAPPLTLLFPTF